MKHIKVLIPFRYNDKLYEPPMEAELPEDVIDRLLKINVNMVLVLGEAKKKRTTKK